LQFDQPSDGFADMAMKAGEVTSEPNDLTYEEESIESIAGAPTAPAPEPAPEEPAAPEKPSEAPPVPEGGLPEGWTMDQWQWYGHEWLAKYGKN
jgi:hypothetical protein